MPDDPYSLGDLARLADVTPRTVRYYIAQGLLPGPESAGPATRYGEGHLARLRLIRRLQREHLPLAEIRIRLERLGDEEVIATVTALDVRPPGPEAAAGSEAEAGGALGYVRSLMARTGVRPQAPYPAPGVRVARLAMRETLADAFRADAAPPPAMATPTPAPAPLAKPAPPSSPLPGPSPAHRSGVERSTWERIVLSPDVELHVRRPLDRHTNKQVDRLERAARELFDEP